MPPGRIETRRPLQGFIPQRGDSLDLHIDAAAFARPESVDVAFDTRFPGPGRPRLKSMPLIDPGMYRAEIFYDPLDRLNAAGFVHIPVVQGERFHPSDRMRLAIRGLAEAMNDNTNIRAVVDNPLPELAFDPRKNLDPNHTRGVTFDMLHAVRPPLVYILAFEPVSLTNEEKECLYRYLTGGGTLIVESGRPGNVTTRKALLRTISQACRGYNPGYGPRPSKPVIPITPDHPLYSSFFSFPGGPPDGAGQRHGGVPFKTLSYLEGVRMGGRFAAIYSDRGYGLLWADGSGSRGQLRIGVNMVVFSLIQRGGNARKWIARR